MTRKSEPSTPAPTYPVYPFQKWLQDVMRAHDWSLRDVATKVGLAPNNVWQWWHGTNVPREEHQEKLARLAGVPLDQISRFVWEQRKRRRLDLAAQRRPGSGPGLIAPPGPDSASSVSEAGVRSRADRGKARGLAGSLRQYAKGTAARSIRSRVKREVARAAATEGASD